MHKVYVNRPDPFFFYNVKMTADYCNFPFETVLVNEEMAASADFKAKKAHGQFPFMETPSGEFVRESSAIAAYMARESGNDSFLGASAFEQAKVDQWVAFAGASLAPNMYAIGLHIFGWAEDKAAHDMGVKNVKDAVKVLNQNLQDQAWLACGRLTLADVVCFNALIIPFTFSLDGGFRKAMPKAAEWFLKMSKLPVVTRTAGYVKWLGAGQEQAAPAGGKAKAAPAAKGGKGGDAKKGGKKGGKAEPAPPKAAAAEDVDEMDLFGDDGGDAAAEAAAALKKKGEEAKAKKKKAAPVAKSLIIWEVKPWGEETDLTALANKILGIEMDGLFWKTEWKKEPVAYGIFKIQIGATVEDEKVSTDLVQEKIEEFEDDVQSVDIVAFNKL